MNKIEYISEFGFTDEEFRQVFKVNPVLTLADLREFIKIDSNLFDSYWEARDLFLKLKTLIPEITSMN